MVEDRAIDRLDRGRKAAGRPAICFARGRIATGMIVREDDSGTAMRRCIGDDLTQRKWRAGLIAGMPGQMEAASLIVDMRNPKVFTARFGIGEATCEERTRCVEAIELQRKFGTLNSHETNYRKALAPATGTESDLELFSSVLDQIDSAPN